MFIEGALQTRKWQGQDGQDRYSTEVVLQGFNSKLTMLDGRGGGGAGAGMQEGGQADYGGGSETSYSDAPRGEGQGRRHRQAARRRDPVLNHARVTGCDLNVARIPSPGCRAGARPADLSPWER